MNKFIEKFWLKPNRCIDENARSVPFIVIFFALFVIFAVNDDIWAAIGLGITAATVFYRGIYLSWAEEDLKVKEISFPLRWVESNKISVVFDGAQWAIFRNDARADSGFVSPIEIAREDSLADVLEKAKTIFPGG